MILGNARVGDTDVDLRIEHGVIAAIDAPGALGTADVDLAGRWLGPGLWDEHIHFTQWALTSQRLDLSAVTSARDAAAAVAAAIESGAAAEAGQLIGAKFRDGLWPDAPNLADLDRASGVDPGGARQRRPALRVAELGGARRARPCRTPDRADPRGCRVRDLHHDRDRARRDRRCVGARRGIRRRPARRGRHRRPRDELEPRRVDPAPSSRARCPPGRVRHLPQHLERAVDEGLRTGDAVGRTASPSAASRCSPTAR